MEIPDEDLAALWHEQQHATFPAKAASRSVGSTTLLKLDAAVGALLTACLRTDGRVRTMDDGSRRRLEKSLDLLRQASRLTDLEEDAGTYFDRLERLATAVLSGQKG